MKKVQNITMRQNILIFVFTQTIFCNPLLAQVRDQAQCNALTAQHTQRCAGPNASAQTGPACKQLLKRMMHACMSDQGAQKLGDFLSESGNACRKKMADLCNQGKDILVEPAANQQAFQECVKRHKTDIERVCPH